MKTLKKSKVSIVLIIEILIVLLFVLKCFGRCEEYTLDQNHFNRCFDGTLRDFSDGYVGIEEQGLEDFDIIDCSLRLGSGAYSIKVIYDSVSDYDTTSADNYAGKIFIDTDGSAFLKMSDMRLRDGLNEMQSRFWLSRGSGDSEVKIHVRYYGNGKLAVKSIQVEEKRAYRVLSCIVVIGLMMVCNLIYIYFIKRDDRLLRQKDRIVIMGIVGITVLSSITYFADFLYSGHDVRFHLARMMSLANALKEFQIPHRMQFEMLNGHGYAAPLYYGELFLVLPAILYNMYLPIQTCYQIFVVVVNLMTGIISYWCFMRMSNDWKKGLVGAFLYTLASYRLMDVMVRAAVGEYTTLMFFPLLIYGFWRVYHKEDDEKIIINDYMPIILAATGIINSHALSCEMVLLFVVVFALINIKRTFRKNIFTALLKSAVCSFLLNMWFVIPFLQSMGMNITINNKESINALEGYSAYAAQIFGIFHTANGDTIRNGTQNEMPLSIGLPITIGICLFVFVCTKKEEWHLQFKGKMRAATVCFVLGLMALFLSSNLCRWDSLAFISKELARIAGMVQFSWRYLGLATAILVAMMIFILQIMEENVSANFYNHIILVLIAAAIITEGHFIMEYINLENEERVYSESDVGANIACAEYLLQGTDFDEYRSESTVSASGEEMECAAFYYDRNGKYYLSCNNKADVEAYVDVPVQAYDNYHAYTSEGEELRLATGENNKIRVFIPSNYNGIICVEYVVPTLWRLSEIISLVTMCMLVILMVQSALKSKNLYHVWKRES